MYQNKYYKINTDQNAVSNTLQNRMPHKILHRTI